MPIETIHITLDDPTNDVGGFGHDYTISTPQFYSGMGLFGPLAAIDGVGGYSHIGAWSRFKLPFEARDVISSAYLHLYSMGVNRTPAYAPWTLQIKAVAYAADNPSNPATRADADTYSSSGATTAYISQDIYPLIEGYGFVIGDLGPIITELIARVGWVENNYALFMFRVIAPVDPDMPDYLSQTVYSEWHFDRGAGLPMDSQYFPTLVVNYYAAPPAPAGQDYIDDLDIVETILFSHDRYDTSELLTMVEDVLYSVAYGGEVSEFMNFVESPNYLKTYDMSVLSVFFMFETIEGNRDLSGSYEDVMEFIQQQYGNTPIFAYVEEFLPIEQDLAWNYGFYEDVEDDFAFVETVRSASHVGNVQQAIHFFETIELAPNLQAYYPVSQVVTFVEDFIYSGVFTRVVDQTLPIVQSYLATGGALAGGGLSPTGNPSVDFGGSSGSGPAPVLPPAPVMQSMTLEWPVVSPTLTFTLPKPLFGNVEDITPTRVQRETRGGTMKTFRDSSWMTRIVNRYKFEGLTSVQVSNFVNFINQTLGLEVLLTDYEGRTWTGFIVNTGAESLQYIRVCGDTTEFDFDGVRND